GVGGMRRGEGMTVSEILALPNNRQVYGQFIVRECEVRGGDGRYFLRLVLGDKTGTIQAFAWNYDVNQRPPKAGDVAELHGVPGAFPSKPKSAVPWGCIARGVRPAQELVEPASIPDFARRHMADIEALLASDVTDEPLTRWGRYCLDDQSFGDRLTLWPAAK